MTKVKMTQKNGMVQSWVAASSTAWGWQSSNSDVTMPKKQVLKTRTLEFCICFGFRISDFGF